MKSPKNESTIFSIDDSACAVFINVTEKVSVMIENIKTAQDLDLLAPTYSLKSEIAEPTPPPRMSTIEVIYFSSFSSIASCSDSTCLESMLPIATRVLEVLEDKGQTVPDTWPVTRSSATTQHKIRYANELIIKNLL
mmetsp:Transcript_2917/g.6265  ORF Transcript_2917/g.6265 Transcript_2917/m.6265 type:complete len:137 (+) Transcript_2917:2527-2937(+)